MASVRLACLLAYAAVPLAAEHDAAVMRLFEAVQKRNGGGGLPPGVLSLSMLRSRKAKPDPL